jgi:hypothetical protein
MNIEPNTLIRGMILLMFPGCAIVFFMGVIALLLGIGDYTTVWLLTIFVGLLALPATLFGSYWLYNPSHVKDIQDGCDKK